jgi:hypothetical protein
MRGRAITSRRPDLCLIGHLAIYTGRSQLVARPLCNPTLEREGIPLSTEFYLFFEFNCFTFIQSAIIPSGVRDRRRGRRDRPGGRRLPWVE